MKKIGNDLWKDGDTYDKKCVYYNGRGKCAFSNQSKCVYDNGMVPFPYSCGVESRAEDEAMFGGCDE